MKGLFMLCVYMTIEMLNYALAYTVIFQAKLRKEKGWIVGSYFLGLGIQILVYGRTNVPLNAFVAILYYIVIPLCWFPQRKKKWFALYPFIVMGMSIITVCASFMLAILFRKSADEVVCTGWMNILCECTGIVVLMFIYIYRKIRHKKPVEVELGWSQYVLLFIGVFAGISILGIAQALSSGIELTTFIGNMYGFLLSVLSVVFVILSLWHGIVTYRQIQYKSQAEQYESFMRLQEEQIHRIVDKDTRMRKFQHDVQEHMIALRGYAQAGDCERVTQYIDEIQQYSYMKQVVNYTGDSAVDAVLRDMFAQAQEKGIRLNIQIDRFPMREVSSFDVCILFSNLLKNAIEACQKIVDKKERVIEVKTSFYDGMLGICIRNCVAEPVVIQDNQLITTKENRKNHGWGTKNVQEVAERYDGTATYTCGNEWFQAELWLEIGISDKT